MTTPISVMVPITMTDAMLSSSTVAEPAAGETAWVSAGTYAVGDLRIRSTTHTVYKCAQAHTGRTALPEVDTAYWSPMYATQKWAMFDSYSSTPTAATTSLGVVLRPGFVNALVVLNPDGAALSVILKDVTGGAVVDTRSISLQEDPLDWYDWAFGQIKTKSKVVVSGLMLYPDPEITVTISASAGSTVKCGMLSMGDYRDLLDGADFGGAQYGATALPTTFSYIKTDEYGNTVIKRRGSASDMSVDVVIPKSHSDGALATLQGVLDVPAVWVASTVQGYAGLTVFGLASGRMNYDNPTHDVFSISVKGML